MSVLKKLLGHKILLNAPIYIQGERSANCGPCSVKTILDYFGIRKLDRTPYSVHSINRMLDTSTEEGCAEERIEQLLHKFGLHTLRVAHHTLITQLQQGRPVLCSFEDELLDGHYAVLVGVEDLRDEDPILIFQDPWPDMGEHFQRRMSEFKEQVDSVEGWLLAVSDEPIS